MINIFLEFELFLAARIVDKERQVVSVHDLTCSETCLEKNAFFLKLPVHFEVVKKVLKVYEKIRQIDDQHYQNIAFLEEHWQICPFKDHEKPKS